MAFIINPIINGNDSLELFIWLLVGFLWAKLILAWINWFYRYIVVTDQRILLTSGLLSVARVRNLPIESIKTMAFRRSRGGRLFGYGAFIFEANARPYMVVDYVPYPEQLYLEVQGLAFVSEDRSLD
jgi:hypothetical protein